MSVDAKLFVTCGKSKLFEVLGVVSNTLNEYTRTKLDEYWKNNTDASSRTHFMHSGSYESEAKKFTNGCSAWFYNPKVIGFNFGCGDEKHRTLRVVSDCDCDYADIYEGEKIILSLGCWGSSEEIIKILAKALCVLGDVYYDLNDCDDVDFQLFQE